MVPRREIRSTADSHGGGDRPGRTVAGERGAFLGPRPRAPLRVRNCGSRRHRDRNDCVGGILPLKFSLSRLRRLRAIVIDKREVVGRHRKQPERRSRFYVMFQIDGVGWKEFEVTESVFEQVSKGDVVRLHPRTVPVGLPIGIALTSRGRRACPPVSRFLVLWASEYPFAARPALQALARQRPAMSSLTNVNTVSPAVDFRRVRESSALSRRSPSVPRGRGRLGSNRSRAATRF